MSMPAPGHDATGMFRSTFGDPKPANLEQLQEAVAETYLDPATAQVYIEDSREESAPFTGWTAEITGDSTEDPDEMVTISTAGFAEKGDLMKALMQIGIPLRNIEDI
jgi:hypothetical protein